MTGSIEIITKEKSVNYRYVWRKTHSKTQEDKLREKMAKTEDEKGK